MADSYNNAKRGGISDGTVEGRRGADAYQVEKRQLEQRKQLWSTPLYGPKPTDAREMGSGLLPILGALFLHRYFCFVGFWLIGCGLLVSVALSFGLYEPPHTGNWYIYLSVYGPMVLPVILAVLLRKIVPTLMKWALVVVVVGVPAAYVIGIIIHLQSR